MGDDRLARRLWGTAQKRHRGKQHSRGTVTALKRAVIEKCLLQRVQVLYPEDYNAYLVIGKSGRVTVFPAKLKWVRES